MSRTNHTSKVTGRRGHWTCDCCGPSAANRKAAQAPSVDEYDLEPTCPECLVTGCGGSWCRHIAFDQLRAEEKQRSRDADAEALRTGSKTREQLQRENGAFAFPNAIIHLDDCKKLG